MHLSNGGKRHLAVGTTQELFDSAYFNPLSKASREELEQVFDTHVPVPGGVRPCWVDAQLSPCKYKTVGRSMVVMWHNDQVFKTS